MDKTAVPRGSDRVPAVFAEDCDLASISDHRRAASGD
jgi:hypothetical protein